MKITQEEIDATLQQFREFNESDIEAFIRMFQRKQEPLLVYVAAVVEREDLNDHEYDLLITNVLLAWEVMRKKFHSLKRLKMNHLRDVDDLVHNSDFVSAPGNEMKGHAQPNLMGTIRNNVLNAEPEVREDRKGVIFATLQHIVDALLQASGR